MVFTKIRSGKFACLNPYYVLPLTSDFSVSEGNKCFNTFINTHNKYIEDGEVEESQIDLERYFDYASCFLAYYADKDGAVKVKIVTTRDLDQVRSVLPKSNFIYTEFYTKMTASMLTPDAILGLVYLGAEISEDDFGIEGKNITLAYFEHYKLYSEHTNNLIHGIPELRICPDKFPKGTFMCPITASFFLPIFSKIVRFVYNNTRIELGLEVPPIPILKEPLVITEIKKEVIVATEEKENVDLTSVRWSIYDVIKDWNIGINYIDTEKGYITHAGINVDFVSSAGKEFTYKIPEAICPVLASNNLENIEKWSQSKRELDYLISVSNDHLEVNSFRRKTCLNHNGVSAFHLKMKPKDCKIGSATELERIKDISNFFLIKEVDVGLSKWLRTIGFTPEQVFKMNAIPPFSNKVEEKMITPASGSGLLKYSAFHGFSNATSSEQTIAQTMYDNIQTGNFNGFNSEDYMIICRMPSYRPIKESDFVKKEKIDDEPISRKRKESSSKKNKKGRSSSDEDSSELSSDSSSESSEKVSKKESKKPTKSKRMKKEVVEEDSSSSVTELNEDAASIPLINTNYGTEAEEELPPKKRKRESKIISLDNDVNYWPIFFDSTLPNGPIDLGKNFTPNLKVVSVALLRELPSQVKHCDIVDMDSRMNATCSEPLPDFIYHSPVWFMVVYGAWSVLSKIAKDYYKTFSLGKPMGIYLSYPFNKHRKAILLAKGIPTFFLNPIPKTTV